ncbi:MAG TPA: hypothetical protein VGF79_13845 [Bacteroidia bacterium]
MFLVSVAGCKRTEVVTSENNLAWFEPEKKQRSLLMIFSATWCPHCGYWGLPTFKATEKLLGDDALALDVHGVNSELAAYQYKVGNDTPFYSKHVVGFGLNLENVEVSGLPSLCVNNKGGYTAGSEYTMADDARAFNAQSPTANINFGVIKNQNGFIVRSTTKFFKETSGEYYVSMFVTENNVANRQNIAGTYDASYIHDNVIRWWPISNGVITDGIDKGLSKTFGNPVVSGQIPAGKCINSEIAFTTLNKSTLLPSGANFRAWDQNSTKDLYLTAIIWKKSSSGKYIFVNGVRKPF